MSWEGLLAGALAGAFTFFDLEKTFYIPQKAGQKRSLSLFFWGFVLVNAALAYALFQGLNTSQASSVLPGWFAALPEWLKALMVGAGYLGFVRLKFTTLKVQDQEIPFGIELFYNGVKNWVYKKINRIAKQARYEETMALITTFTLADLTTRAKISTDADALLSTTEKALNQQWIEDVVGDLRSPEVDKKATLAAYILSGDRNS